MARTSRLLSAVFAVCLFLLIVTVSVSLPIYIRPVYYAHIEPLGLEARSGYSAREIREAYDAVLDYLTIPGREFSTGVFAHSADGAAHFADCKVLLDLNRNVLLLCAGAVILLAVLRKRGKTGPYRLGRHSAAFWAAVLALTVPVVIGALAAADFDRAFVIFHSLFFPGKDNWLFDGRTDPIIRVLPKAFFMHCAMLIGAGLLVMSLAVLIMDRLRERKREERVS